MTFHELDELGDNLRCGLRSLPTLTAEEGRAARVRTRCHTAIARRHLQIDRSARRGRFSRRVLEPVMVGGLCLIYLWAVILDVLRLRVLP